MKGHFTNLGKIADFDPEADGAAEAESGSEEDEDVAGTEHYVSVGYAHFSNDPSYSRLRN